MSARLPSASPVRRLALASHSITPIETAVSTIPTGLGSGASALMSVRADSNATYAARMRKDTPTNRSARRSTRSMPSSSRSPRSSLRKRQMRTTPEMVSTMLSAPKATSAMEPLARPARMATRPSSTFQPTVRYSSSSPRRMSAGRAIEASMHVRYADHE